MLIPIAQNLWLLSYPLKLGGVDVRKAVTVVRLNSAKVVILSAGPFDEGDATQIRAVGLPTWLVEGMLRHDTFTNDGWAAFPGITVLGPSGFEEHVKFPVRPILPTPAEWAGELVALELAGVPSMRETVFFHPLSRTLIVQDLAFNFPAEQPLLKEAALRLAVGKHHSPGVSRSFSLGVKDRPAFEQSLRQMLAWDFDRLIVGHGDMIETGAKARLLAALHEAKFLETTEAGA